MKKNISFALTIMVLTSCKNTVSDTKLQTLNYPKTYKESTVDTYFGVEVADPYRWLEDDRSKETAQWVSEQNKVTFAYLDQIPFRKQLEDQLRSKWNYEKIGAPFKEGSYTYYFKNDGLQNQSVMYRKNVNGEEELFLDPNTFSKDGTTSLSDVSFTKDGSLMAYAISEGGSDWRKIIVINTADRSKVGETLVDVKFSGIAWYKNEGFYYSSYDKPQGSELSSKTDQHKLYYHQLGTSQSSDKVIYGDKEKRRYVMASVTENQRFLVITTANATSGNELLVKDLTRPDAQIVSLVSNFDNDYSVVDADNTYLYVNTNYQAPNKRLIAVALSDLNVQKAKNIIPEREEVLSVSKAGGFFFASYMKDAVSVVKQFDYSGKEIRTVELPGLGTAGGFGNKRDANELYYTFTNYTTPGTIYKYDIQNGTSEIYQKPKVNFNSENYESKQIFYTSKDGTKVPMIITYKKGTKLNGKNPTMLYAYGGFNVSLTPSFSVANAVWMENGGIYAVPNLRGGGEYGKKWHIAGIKLQKQNVFDDFIAAAEYLIEENYTSSEYLAIRGGSNGGLLVGATMTQKPDLMKVSLPAVGVLDMLRYHQFTSGAGWAYDYGTSEESEEMFQYLKTYSPLHNVKKGVSYPATMITTGDHDDRVVPAHSFKFAAELQEKNEGPHPMLIRIDVNAGHGAGKSVEQTIKENADIQAFTLYNMGVKPKK